MALIPAAGLAGGAGPAAAAPQHVTPAVAGDISTVAGGPGGPAKGTKIDLNLPCGLTYGGGAVYFGDFHDARKIAPQTGVLSTPAGSGFSGPLGNGGPATGAFLNDACGVAVDHHGDLVVADSGNQLIRVVAHKTGQFYQQAMTAGDIYAVAGGGSQLANGVPALQATLSGVNALAVDASGNLLLADTSHQQIWVVAEMTGTFYGQPMTAGDIYLVAGDGSQGSSGDGGPATAAQLNQPAGVTADDAGTLLIADTGSQRIRVVAAGTGTFYGQSMFAGDIYTVAGNGTAGFSGDGGRATAAELSFPQAATVDGAGNLLLADTENERIRVVAAGTGTFYGQSMTAGDIYTVAGNGTAGFSGDRGPAASAHLNNPVGVTADRSGNLVIADEGNARIRVVAAKTGTFYGQPMTASDIYTVAGKGSGYFSVYGGPATSAQFRGPYGVAADAAGDVAIADFTDQRVLVVAGGTGTFYGQNVTAGHIYIAAGNGKHGFSGDGGPAAMAELNFAYGVAADAAGNLVIADSSNNRVRVVARSAGTFYGRSMTAGDIYTVAGDGTAGFSGDGGPATSASLNFPRGVAVDGAGNLVIADGANNRIRVVAATAGTFYGQAMTAGDIYTVAGDGTAGFSGDGGPATSAAFSSPEGVAVDGSGNLVIADSNNNRVRVVAVSTGTFYGRSMTARDVYTVAGDGTAGFSGDSGPATSAEIHGPPGIAVDGSGNVLITDTGADRVRVVAARTGTFYGLSVTAGDIYTLAGDGTAGFSGNGGPAAGAELSGPTGITVNGAGNVLFADMSNTQIREISG
jgi:hypothetical protein